MKHALCGAWHTDAHTNSLYLASPIKLVKWILILGSREPNQITVVWAKLWATADVSGRDSYITVLLFCAYESFVKHILLWLVPHLD